jgi:hypothetical protein
LEPGGAERLSLRRFQRKTDMAQNIRPPPGQDPLIRLVLVNLAVGAFMGVAFAALLLAADFAGLRSLIVGTSVSGSALVLLFGGFAITFGGIVVTTAVMLMNDRDDHDGGDGIKFEPAPVRVRARRRR